MTKSNTAAVDHFDTFNFRIYTPVIPLIQGCVFIFCIVKVVTLERSQIVVAALFANQIPKHSVNAPRNNSILDLEQHAAAMLPRRLCGLPSREHPVSDDDSVIDSLSLSLSLSSRAVVDQHT